MSRAVGHRGLGQPWGRPALALPKVRGRRSASARRAGTARTKAGRLEIGGRKLGLTLRQKDCQRAAKGEIRYALTAEGGSSDIPPVRSNSTHEKEHEEN